MFGFSILYNKAFNVIDKFIRQVDPSQQFSAPFKAGNSRQVQTCYKIQNTAQRKLATLSGSYQFRRNGSSPNLEPQSMDVMMLAAYECSHFHFDPA